MMQEDIKSQFPLRILNSVQDRVREEARRTGQSINKTGEALLIEALNARREQLKGKG